MSRITKHVEEPWFSLIKNGKKNIEGRLNKGRFQNLMKDDIVIWNNNNNQFKTKIISIHYHKNFKTMIKQHRLKNVLPGVKTIAEGIEIYSKFYSDSDVLKYGVLAIKLKKVII